jgi:hypothetical protein
MDPLPIWEIDESAAIDPDDETPRVTAMQVLAAAHPSTARSALMSKVRRCTLILLLTTR